MWPISGMAPCRAVKGTPASLVFTSCSNLFYTCTRRCADMIRAAIAARMPHMRCATGRAICTHKIIPHAWLVIIKTTSAITAHRHHPPNAITLRDAPCDVCKVMRMRHSKILRTPTCTRNKGAQELVGRDDSQKPHVTIPRTPHPPFRRKIP